MLSPRKSQVILLPEDRHLIEILGWDEDQYRYFVRQASTYNDIRPGQPTMFWNFVIGFVIKLVIGLALSYLASLLAPRQGSPGQIKANTPDGQNIVSGGRFAPRTGFASSQNVVEMGSVVPVVFAKRELLDGQWYGGVRINTNLLWSQLLSIGTGQILRAVFMVGEGPIGSLDPRQFAIGDNLLGSYDLDSTNNTSGRCSIYFRPGGGLLVSGDHIAGRLAANDDGNAENSGGSSVFDVRGVNQVYQNDFCYVSKPSNQTAFGVYSGMGNNLAYRVNPTIRSTSAPQLKPKGDKGDARVSCNPDTEGKAARDKYNTVFSSRSGMYVRNSSPTADGQQIVLNVGDTVDYRLDSSSDYKLEFVRKNPKAKVKCIDVAQAIAGRQRQWDDSIVLGELYKFGQALLICISRTPDDAVFVSEAESEPPGGGVSITASFRVVKEGLAQFTSLAEITRKGDTPGTSSNGTLLSHLFRCAVSSFVVDRPTQVIEIGYNSTLGIRYSSLCNFRDSLSYDRVDYESCGRYKGKTIGKGKTFNTRNITSGIVSIPEKRYSFFRVLFRIAGSDEEFTEIDVNFGFCSQTEQPSFNYLRLQFSSAQRWEVMHRPTTGWEIRNNLTSGPLILLDARSVGAAKTGSANGVVFNYSGEIIANNASTFGMPPTIPSTALGVENGYGDLGLGGKDGLSYVDAYGALAEVFAYEEVQSTATQPEHQIAYVNLISPNPTVPTYENITTIGLNLRSGPGFSELSQFSAYVNCGFGATHLFPEVYAILLTNEVFGVGNILSPAQINFDSFLYAADWTNTRRYFFDMGVSDPFNVRSKGAEWAKLFLLDLSTKNGQFYLSPIAEFGKVYSPVAMFTSGNANSVEVSERDSQDRQPIRVSVKWREERQSSDLSGRGLFPVIREISVREAGTSEAAPLVQIDISEFGTSELHAIDVAKMRCREQVLITHDVKLQLIPDWAALEPGAVFKVGLELLSYEQPNNGVILADGSTTTTSGTSLSDGTYEVVLWDGTGDSLTEVTILVEDGKVDGYSNAVFCIADSAQAEQIFKAQVIDYDEDGNLEVTASYFPLEDDGTSSLLANWTDPGSWVIEGLVGALPPDVPLDPGFDSVAISGSLSTVKNENYTYIAEINGPSDEAYTYAWTGTNVTIDSPSAESTNVVFPAAGTGILNLTVTKTVGGVIRSASKTIVVEAFNINSVSIDGDSYRIGAGTVALTAVIAEPYSNVTYEWSLEGQGSLATPTASSTLLTVDETSDSRIVELTAVIDEVVYSAIKFVDVYESIPLQIVGPAIADVDTYSYTGELFGVEQPELSEWTFAWTITGNLNASLLGAATGRGTLVGSLSVLNTASLSGAATGTGALAGTITAAAATDPDFSNVSLLLPMDGTNGSTTFTDASSNAFVGTANGNAQISTTDPKFGTGCLLLDGTGDFINYAHDSAFSIGNVFTIEAWIKFDVFNAGVDTILSKWGAGSLINDEFLFYYENSTGQLGFDFRTGTTYNSLKSSAAPLSVGTYHYLAVSRNGSNWTFNVGGTTSTATNSAAINNTGVYGISVGRLGGYTIYDVDGRMDELRLTKGVARDISSVPTAAFPTDGPPPASLSGIAAGTGALAGTITAAATASLSGAATGRGALAGTITRVGGLAADPYFDNVVLLLPLNNPDGTIYFTDVSPTHTTLTTAGNARIRTAWSKWGGSSGYCDGTGDYATISSPSATLREWWNGGAYSVEAWIRMDAVPAFTSLGSPLIGNMDPVSNVQWWSFGPNNDGSGGKLIFRYWNGSANQVTGTTTLTTGVDYFIQLIVSGTTIELWLDGALEATATVSGTPQSSASQPFTIGQSNNNGYNGYFDDVRITAGLARPTTVPTVRFPLNNSPVDPYFANVSLLLSMQGPNNYTTFNDLSNYAHTISVFGNAKVSTIGPWVFGVLELGGAGDYLTIPASDAFAFGTGDFTVEGFVTPNTVSDNDGVFSIGDQLFLTLYDGSWYAGTNGTGYDNYGAATADIMQHFALTRAGTTMRLFIDGNLLSSRTASRNLTSNTMNIGYYVSPAYSFNGQQSWLRVTKGVARYTSAFLPPVLITPYPTQ